MKLLNIISPPKSLKLTLITHIVIPLVIALGLFGYFAFSSIEGEIEKQMQNDLELMARAIQLPLVHSLQKDRMGSIQQTLESVFAIGRVYGAYIYDNEGELIANLGLTDPAFERERFMELASDGEERGEYDRIAGRRVFSYFLPLTDSGGRIIGLLHLTRRASDFRNHLLSIRIKGIIGLGLFLSTLFAIILYGYHRALGRHLKTFASGMFRVAQGDQNHRLHLDGPKEIVELGENFNNMLDSIEKAEHELLRHQKQQKRLEEELRQAEKLASLGRFSAGTAHELGNPLSVIGGNAQRALRCKEIPAPQRKALVSIREEVERMKYIIRQLLDFSHRSPIHRSKAMPKDLITSTIRAVKEEAHTINTKIIIDQPEPKVPVYVDTIRIQQALLNLIRNAVYCAPNGTVRCSWEFNDGNVIFCIEDDGPGVDQSLVTKIFEPFFTTKTVGEGTGLGLSVTHRIAEEHGGTIRVTKSALGGACFRLTIPSENNHQLK